MTFNGRFVLNIIHFAGMQGASIDELIKISGVSAEALCQEDSRVSMDVYDRVLTAIIHSTNDPYFGLHLGEHLNLAAAGLIAQITQTSRTIKEALYYCCEFATLGCQALPMTLVEQADHYELHITPDPIWAKENELVVRHTIEGVLAFFIREFQALTLQKQRPIGIHIPIQQPATFAEYERILGCPLFFNKKEAVVLLSKQQVETPVITSDFNLLRILIQHAEEKVQQMENKQGFFNLVRKSMVRLIKPEFPTIDQVASNLNISVRTLQRRLKSEGHTYKSLLEELRRDFAFQYLRKGGLSINEVAHLLSYADPSSFIRSFKRWAGMTPGEWREQQESKAH